jgi:uncharacterized protein YqfB (UPF0267 family)
MKTLKFKPHLCEQILEGVKTSTWRLFDDKDLKEGDVLTLLNKETLDSFGTAVITSLYTKTLGTLEDKDWEGHERFASDEEMYATYRKYYGNNVNEDSEVKIISFAFNPLLKDFNNEAITYIEILEVKAGVFCDVYQFTNDTGKDLGIVRVQKGSKTPLQKVLSGDNTIEIFKDGKGVLTITDVNGNKIRHEFPSETTEVEIKVGELMQWEALEDLTFAEVCFPPYQDGRYKNIEEN